MNPVTWHDAALDALADIWVEASPDEGDRIEAAVKQINGQLRQSPEDRRRVPLLHSTGRVPGPSGCDLRLRLDWCPGCSRPLEPETALS